MASPLFTTPNPAPVPSVALTAEVWQQRKLPNSQRTTRILMGSVGQLVTEEQAKEWGVGGKPSEGYYFVDPDAPDPDATRGTAPGTSNIVETTAQPGPDEATGPNEVRITVQPGEARIKPDEVRTTERKGPRRK
jgi:hypothetical protein